MKKPVVIATAAGSALALALVGGGIMVASSSQENAAKTPAPISAPIAPKSSITLTGPQSARALEKTPFVLKASNDLNGSTVGFYQQGKSIGTAKIKDGQATLVAQSLVQGNSTITAKITDGANKNLESNALKVTITNAYPITLTSSGSILPTENTTLNMKAPAVLNGSKVGLYQGNKEIAAATIKDGGASFQTDKLVAGNSTVQVKVLDGQNKNVRSNPLTVNIKKVTPLTLSGPIAAQPGQKVTLTLKAPVGLNGQVVGFYQNGQIVGTATIKNGTATFKTDKLVEGNSTVQAKVINPTVAKEIVSNNYAQVIVVL